MELPVPRAAGLADPQSPSSRPGASTALPRSSVLVQGSGLTCGSNTSPSGSMTRSSARDTLTMTLRWAVLDLNQ